MSVAMFLSLVPPVARVTETVRAGSGANASRTPGSKCRVFGNPRVGPRRRGYTEFSVRTTGWRTTTTASSSSSTPSTRQDGMTRASLNANAAAARGTVGQSVGSRGAKKNEASLLKTETEKELFDEFEMEIEARHADTRGEESTPKLVRLPTGDAVAPWWHKGGSLPNVAEARSSREFMQRFAEAKVQSKTDGKKKLIVVEFLAGWCFACRALHPKLTKIASSEFAHVLFLRVRKEEAPSLCDAMGIDKLPYVQMHLVDGNAVSMVDGFPVNLNAQKLEKLRSAISQHSLVSNGKAAWKKGVEV